MVAAATDVAGEVQFRETSSAAAGKTAVVKEITTPAYGRVELKPDGVHLLLTGLKRPLKTGETITFTLTTDAGLVLSVPATVRPE